jgi:hypothetical protein
VEIIVSITSEHGQEEFEDTKKGIGIHKSKKNKTTQWPKETEQKDKQ